jgi:agmatinase
MYDTPSVKPSIPRFPGSLERIDEAELVLAGFPYDCTASFRAGARFAPAELRTYVIDQYDTFSFYFEEDLSQKKFFDAGDVEKTFGNPGPTVDLYQAIAQVLMQGGRRLVGIGGDHLVHFPLWLAARELCGDFAVIQLDAHADLCEEYQGERLTHGSVMKRCLDKGLSKLIQYGVRCLYREEHEVLSAEERITSAKSITDIEAALEDEDRVYITLDVDFFDPSIVPATGTPEPGGHSFQEFMAFLRMIREKKLHVVGANVVELAPGIDPTRNSTIFVSRILRELLICM